jgi:hypothetical protein
MFILLTLHHPYCQNRTHAVRTGHILSEQDTYCSDTLKIEAPLLIFLQLVRRYMTPTVKIGVIPHILNRLTCAD